jgi:molybdopterin synthase catalytic subunit
MTGYLTDDPIDADALAASVMRQSDGALAVFSGVVRNHHEGHSVESILYEAYRPMAEQEIGKVVSEVARQYPDTQIAVQHRLGMLAVGDASIVIACASPHRAEAFAACREVIDRVKETVPIWKKERTAEGDSWVGWQS